MQKSRSRYEKMDPEFSRCRTSSVGAVIPGNGKEMFYCSIDNADCRFAMPIGYDYVCKHVNSHAFSRAEDL